MRLLLAVLLAGLPLWAQETPEEEPAPELASKPPVTIIFTPPDLAGRIVLGIFDAAGKLRRTLRYDAGAPELKIDTNGYIAQWDGLDEDGRPCAAGRYAAHGFVVGDEVSVEGEAFYFNDWMAEDQLPAQRVELRRWARGLGVEIETPAGPVTAEIGPDGVLTRVSMAGEKQDAAPPKMDPPPLAGAAGRDGTTWLIVDREGQPVVRQMGPDEAVLRELRVPKDEPQPVAIVAAADEDAILLKEAGAGGEQRVRLLRRGGPAEEKDGRRIADWEVVFERTLRPCADFGVIDGQLAADAGAAPPNDRIAVELVENALEPGAKTRLELQAVGTRPGSALAAPGGLALIEISAAGDWNRFALGPGADGTAALYQGDGIVVEQFRLGGLDHLAAFDAGSFLLAPFEK